MKTKILFGIMALILGAFVAGCSDDDDYAISHQPLLTDQSVTTGSADVTPTSAILHGSVSGLEGQAASAYTTGFYYGAASDALTEQAVAPSGADFTATINGSVGETIYYQAFVTLQGRVTYRGTVQSLVLTNARAVTGAASEVSANGASLAGELKEFPSSAEAGIILSGVQDADAETVRSGVRIPLQAAAGSYKVQVSGLMPNTTYSYVAYLDLGAGMVYGDVATFTTDTFEFDLDNDLVDLGLSTKWARYNVGATSESEVGGLFGFGDLTGYNASIDPALYASADVYKTASDAAFRAFGGKVTMPTIADFEELFKLCQREWVEENGVGGFRLTGPNGNSIFLPAVGSRIAGVTEGAGLEGYYLSGSVNPTDPRFALAYQFSYDRMGGNRVTTPVYQALAIRPVSTAKNVPFVKEQLFTRWYLDNGQDGKQHVFEGPFTQWGVTDTWGTISNGEPNIYQDIHWEMGTGNGWIGYTYGKDYGYMDLKEDGTVLVHRIAEDGTVTDEEGHFTLDLENKVIDIDIPVICANTWIGTKSGKLNILTLTEDGLQIALPADDTYAYSLNYYSQAKADKDMAIPVSLLCVGGDWGGTWGSIVDNIAPVALDGQHSFTYQGACNGAMVFLLDFQGLKSRYPNAFVRIDEMKCDGNSIKFDGNHFFYGDIEDNGNYRIELFNIWGKGQTDGLIRQSPFSSSQNIGSDPAFQFSETLEIVYTIMTDAQVVGSYTPNLITINPSWGGTWGFNQGAQLQVVYDEEACQYRIENPSFDILYAPTDVDHSAGSIMTFIEVADLFGYFPGAHATLDALLLDGTEVTGWDATRVVDTSEGNKYRLELWNMYGATSATGSAFGPSDGGTVHELGFTTSMQVKFTFHSLYAVPQW